MVQLPYPQTEGQDGLRLNVVGLCVAPASGIPSSDLLRDVTLSLRKGEIVGVMGESGSGKTTLFRAVLGLLSSGLVASGTVRLLGVDLYGEVSKSEIRLARRRIAFVSQNPYAGFVPDVSIGRQLRFLADSRGFKDDILDGAERLLLELGLKHPVKALRSLPRQLSGGQLQRLQLALALLVRPDLILADEITASLDPNNAKRVAHVLLEHHQEHGTTVLLASHDLWLIQLLCDHWYRVEDRALLLQ
ncbi:MAG: ATP-binding cassette domain-containing protein [Candidatus Thiodiazotropha sp.]